MPKGTIRTYLGGRKKLSDGSDPSKISTKLNKKLPPLLSNLPDTKNTQTQNDVTLIEQQSVVGSAGIDKSENGHKSNSTDNSRQESNSGTSKNRYPSKRRSGTKYSSACSNSASSSVQKRVLAKPKIVDVEQIEVQIKTKIKKKTSVKLKPVEKQQQETEVGATDMTNTEGNWTKQLTNSLPKPQWTNIVKRVQIHKHQSQKSKTRPLKKKEPPKRKKSEYVIENTWLPREPTADSTVSQKVTTKKVKSNGKVLRDRKSKELADTSRLPEITPSSSDLQLGDEKLPGITSTSELGYTDEERHVLSANVIFQGNTGDPISGREGSITPEQKNGKTKLVLSLEENSDDPPISATEISNQPIISMGNRDESNSSTETSNQPIKVHQMISSPKLNSSPKMSYSPKLHNRDRETTHVNQINVADFAKLNVKVNKPVEMPAANLNVTDYQYRISKVRFKGASNSVPNYNDKQENVKKVVAQNDALLSTVNKSKKLKDNHSIHVSKIEPISPGKSAFLLPTTVPHRNMFMDMLIGDARSEPLYSGRSSPDSSFPRLNYGSPTPPQKAYNGCEDEMAGEISIVVPKLPYLNNNSRVTIQSSGGSGGTDEESKAGCGSADFTDTTHHTDDEPIVIVTNVDGVDMGKAREADQRDGWESGYNSMTPRLSIDSRSHALTPMSGVMAGSALHLEIPNEHRSSTPFSTITTSTYLDHSRPCSTFRDVPNFIGETHDQHSRKSSIEHRSNVNKLPAIYSRNNDIESTDGRGYDFTPLPLQSVRTSDGDLSD